MKAMKKLVAIAAAFLFLQGLFGVEITAANAEQYREKFVEEVKKYIGCPYEYGSVGPSTFDCSGLINFSALNSTGIQLPRTAKAIYNAVTIVSPKNREIGDLLFFKTTGSDSITHVGVYIGNDQFISAISDGPNTGVIVSSLNQDYWKPRYVATGKFLPSSTEDRQLAVNDRKDNAAGKKETDKKTTSKKSTSFTDDLILDGNLFVNWSLLSARSFAFQFRGLDFTFNARYSKWLNEPGIQMGFFYDAGLGLFQIPVVISLTINDYVRAYAGPVFSFGNPDLIGSDKEIRPSVFPGVIGLTLSTDKLNLGPVDVQFAQNICYTVYNNIDNSALSIFESLTAGLVFHTGIKISLPLSVIAG